MVTYNADFVCSYMGSDSNDAYRDDLLDILGMERYDDELINSRIGQIASEISGSEQLKPILLESAGRLLSEDPEVGLMLLFSYDTLCYAHVCLSDFYRRGEIAPEHLQALKSCLSGNDQSS
jgi:hypothetical protein